MPALTRRRDPAAHDETWLIHYDDVHVGTIRMRTGVPTNVDQWGWTIGFYPVSHRGLRASGTARSLDMARGAFETAWRWLLPQITQADFVEHRITPCSPDKICELANDLGCDLSVSERTFL